MCVICLLFTCSLSGIEFKRGTGIDITPEEHAKFLMEDFTLAVHNNHFDEMYVVLEELLKDHVTERYQGGFVFQKVMELVKKQKNEFKQKWKDHFVFETDNFLKTLSRDPKILIYAIFSERKKEVLRRLYLLNHEQGNRDKSIIAMMVATTSLNGALILASRL